MYSAMTSAEYAVDWRDWEKCDYRLEEWPDTKNKMTKRQKECLVMLCCGLIPDFHVHNRSEMVALAWEMELVTPRDIQLYNLKKERGRDRPVPQWAAVKRKCDGFLDNEQKARNKKN